MLQDSAVAEAEAGEDIFPKAARHKLLNNPA